MAICQACGKEQTGASAFCSNCGAVLDRPDTNASAAEPAARPTQIIAPPVPPPAPPPESRIHAAPIAPVSDFGDIGLYIARRLLALIVDIIGVTVLLATGIHFIFVNQGQDANSYATFFETGVYTLFALLVYLCVTEAYLGATLGKALFGLRVQAVGGGHVGIVRALVRNVFLPFDLCAIGFVLAVITPRRKRIGDFVAGTEVVNTRVGALAPIVAVVILAGWAYAEYAYADGLRMAQVLSNSAQTYGPGLIGGQPTPVPGPTPLPERTAVPTEQPITVPTLKPTPGPSPSGAQTPSSAAPSGSPSAAPASSGSPGPASSATPAPTSSSSAASSSASPAPTPAPTKS